MVVSENVKVQCSIVLAEQTQEVGKILTHISRYLTVAYAHTRNIQILVTSRLETLHYRSQTSLCVKV